MKLRGRRSECEALDRLCTDALAGLSRVTVYPKPLLLLGRPIPKTAPATLDDRAVPGRPLRMLHPNY
jgi:hypothetical protein